MGIWIAKGVLQYFKDEEFHTRIIIPHGIRVIGEAAFSGKEYLYHAVIPDTVERIGQESFADYRDPNTGIGYGNRSCLILAPSRQG